MSDDVTIGVRSFARGLVEILDEVGDDLPSRSKDIHRLMEDLLAVPGLESVIGSPQWAGDAGATASTAWLYYDCGIRLVRGRVPAGWFQQPHNHGAWNIFGVYSGAVYYRSYRRLDDRSRPYRAELEIDEDRVMTPGDVSILPSPPHDIHAVGGLATDSVTLLVGPGGRFADIREIYLPDKGAYYEGTGDGAPLPK
jgi:predicted metal-dependent enzyme (double-stranded beta helix superfamily)